MPLCKKLFQLTCFPETGKKEKKEKKPVEEVAASAELNKTSTVVKQFVVDYTTQTFEPLMEYEVNGFTYRYVYGNDRLSVTVKGVTTSSGNIIENGDEIRLYYHMDYLGTADYLTSPVSGKVTAWTHYNEWGEITHNAVLKCGQRELDMVKRYATHDYDSVLGMYYAKARFYDAAERRFTAVDPVKGKISDPLSLTQYLYVAENPLVWFDPLGETKALIVRDSSGNILRSTYLYDERYEKEGFFHLREVAEALSGPWGKVKVDWNEKTSQVTVETWKSNAYGTKLD